MSNSLLLKKYKNLHIFFLNLSILGAYFERSVFFPYLKPKNFQKRGNWLWVLKMLGSHLTLLSAQFLQPNMVLITWSQPNKHFNLHCTDCNHKQRDPENLILTSGYRQHDKNVQTFKMQDIENREYETR